MRGRSALLWAVMAAAPAAAQHDRWQELVNQGGAAELAGDYTRALALYREASAVADAFDRADSRRVYAFNGQGLMYDALGRFADAEMAYRRALDTLDLSSGKPNLNRAVLLGNLANVCVEMGQGARAEKLLRESLAIHTALVPPDELRLSLARSTLAELLTITGRHAEAETLLRASLEFLERQPGKSTELGIAHNNLGALRLYQRRYAEAEAELEQAIAILQVVRGPNHPILLRTLHNLAVAQERNGRPRAAGDTWRRTVDLAATALGLEHPLYGEILGNYARHLRGTGDKAQSKALAARSDAILRDHGRRNGLGGVVDVSVLERK